MSLATRRAVVNLLTFPLMEILGEPGCEKERPGPEKTLQLLIKFRIWGDVGRHFAFRGIPLGC